MTSNEQKWLSICVGFIVFFFAYTSIVTFMPVYVLRDPDTLCHIRTGQWILQHFGFPETDSFSHTFFGKPWIAKEWLSQVLLASAFEIGGWPAVVMLTAGTCAAIAAILTAYLMCVLRFSVAFGLAVVTFSLTSPHWLARPHTFAYLILCCWLLILLRADDRNRPPPSGLAALMILWANIHSSFVLGLILFYIVAGFGFFRQARSGDTNNLKWIFFGTILVTLAALATPYGIFPLTLTWTIMGMHFALAHIQEWQPPNFRQSPIHLAYVIGLFAVMTGLGLRLPGPRVAILMIMVGLGFSYLRGFFIFVLTIPFIFARPLGRQVAFFNPQSSEASVHSDPLLRLLRRHAFGICAGCAVLAGLTSFLTWGSQDLEPPRSAAPRAAIHFVRLAGISGRVFNSYDFGGYLIFSGIPTFVDGRAELYGDAFLQKYFDAVGLVDIREAFRLLDEHKIDWIILNPVAPLARALQESNAWNTVYSDDTSMVFVRRQ